MLIKNLKDLQLYKMKMKLTLVSVSFTLSCFATAEHRLRNKLIAPYLHRRGIGKHDVGRDLLTSGPCLTEEVCRKRSEKLGYEYFYSGTFPSKGCFAKKDKAYFSPGTEKEMSADELAGEQERVWCAKKEDNFSPGDKKCLTEEECRVKSQGLGMVFYTGSFDTKGCFTKNDKVFFSPGTTAEMMTTTLSGVQQRISCKKIDVQPDDVDQNIICLTQEECGARSKELGMEFYSGQFGTSSLGCFSKNNKVFFSLGTTDEMSTLDLPPLQLRVFCDKSSTDVDMNIGVDVTSTPSSSPTMKTEASSQQPTFASPTMKPTKRPTPSDLGSGDNIVTSELPLKPTRYPTTIQPTKVPTKKPVADILDAGGQLSPSSSPTMMHPTDAPYKVSSSPTTAAPSSLVRTGYPTTGPSSSIDQSDSVSKAVSGSKSNVPNSASGVAFSIGVVISIGAVIANLVL